MVEDSTSLGTFIQSAYVSGTAPDDPYVWVAKTAGGIILGGDPSTFDSANDAVSTVTNVINVTPGIALQSTLLSLNDISVGDVETAVVTALASYDVPTEAELLNALNTVPAATVTALLDEALTEISSDPGASPLVRNLLMLMYQLVRNKLVVTQTEKQITNDAGAVILEQDVNDDGTKFTQSQVRVPS